MPVAMTKDDFDELLKLAESGHPQAIESLRDLIASDRETWRPFGDLTEHVKRQLLDSMTRGSLVARESLNENLSELHEELQQGTQSPIRKLAIDQVLLCWLDTHYQQAMATEPRNNKSDTEFVERRLARSQKRFQNALEFLAKLDKHFGLQASNVSDSDDTNDSEGDANRAEATQTDVSTAAESSNTEIPRPTIVWPPRAVCTVIPQQPSTRQPQTRPATVSPRQQHKP